MKITVEATQKEQQALAAAFDVADFDDVEAMLNAMLTMIAIVGKSAAGMMGPEGTAGGKIIEAFDRAGDRFRH